MSGIAKADTPRPFFTRILQSVARLPGSRQASTRDVQRVIGLCHALLSERAEVSGVRIATEILTAFASLEPPMRERFFDLLADTFAPDTEELGRAIDAYRALPSQSTLLELQIACEPPRQELFRRLNLAPDGTAALVEMREQLLNTLDGHPDRRRIDRDLEHLFRSWFNGGFLVLQQIDWRTSALVLERLIQYEAVHQIQGWDDLHRRLEADRRCYAFFHPGLPEQPLIFIEVALTHGMSAKVQPLLHTHSEVVDPASSNCAIFYSITNCQKGLRGVSFGNLLIKQVVEALRSDFPRVKTFATLSPIPLFRKWLESAIPSDTGRQVSTELKELLTLRDHGELAAAKPISTRLRGELTSLCAYYLLHAKQDKAPLDPVARFHLANGARLERLNWLGDSSEIGMRRSLGLMANYVYRLNDLERNHEAYASDFRVIASRELERLAKQTPFLSSAASTRSTWRSRT